MPVKHKFNSAITDTGESTLVGPNAWNDSHTSDHTITPTSTNYTVLTTDEVVLATAGVSGITVTLLSAVGIAGRVFFIKRVDSAAGNVTINTTSSQTIDGFTTYTLVNQYQYIRVMSDGANWHLMANN